MLALPTILGSLLVSPAPLPIAAPTVAPVHCQVPCGIYGDHLRVMMIREDATTIEKAMTEIERLGSEQPTNFNQIVRWVTTKDDHAQRIQDQLSQYWLAQRIKKPARDGTDEMAARRRYVAQLTQIHEMTVAAMKCKQTTDVKHVEEIRQALETLRAIYFTEEDLEHIRQHALESVGLTHREALVDAKREVARANLKRLSDAVTAYRIDNAGRLPRSLEVLVTRDEKGARYIDSDEVPLDPWGNEYVYEAPEGARREMRLYSLGADGKKGGEGENADIAYER